MWQHIQTEPWKMYCEIRDEGKKIAALATVRWKVKIFADAVLFDGGPERELVDDVAGFDDIALHDDFAVAEEVRIHHPGSDHGDDDLVSVDDAAPSGFGGGELVRDRAVDFRRVHRIDEPGVAFPVAVAHVVMAGRGREEEALADGQVLVGEGEAEVDAFAACGLVCFVEEGEVEIRLGENFKGIAAFLRGRERADAGLQFAKVFQPVENPALQIWRRFRVGGGSHCRETSAGLMASDSRKEVSGVGMGMVFVGWGLATGLPALVMTFPLVIFTSSTRNGEPS